MVDIDKSGFVPQQVIGDISDSSSSIAIVASREATIIEIMDSFGSNGFDVLIRYDTFRPDNPYTVCVFGDDLQAWRVDTNEPEHELRRLWVEIFHGEK